MTSTVPPSPRLLRRRDHKDSFATFAHASIDDKAARDEDGNVPESELQTEPLWHKIIMTPLLSISFILSLFFVNRQHRAARASEHPQAPQSFWVRFQQWLDPEPYQDPNDTTWQMADAGEGEVPAPIKPRWFTRKKHRKMAKLQLDEAGDMHETVVLLLVVGVGMALAGLAWIFYRAYLWFER